MLESLWVRIVGGTWPFYVKAICGRGGAHIKDDGFLPACEDFGDMFDHSPPAFFLYLYLEVEITSRTLISLFVPGSIHSGSSSRDDCG